MTFQKLNQLEQLNVQILASSVIQLLHLWLVEQSRSLVNWLSEQMNKKPIGSLVTLHNNNNKMYIVVSSSKVNPLC